MTVVAEFHRAFGHPAPPAPPLRPDPALVRLRLRLIKEEFNEVNFELLELVRLRDQDPDTIATTYRRLLKELADLRYVVDGCAVALGLPIDEAVDAVHASNMSKRGEDGKPIVDKGGKVLKGPNYTEPDMLALVPAIIEGD